jgi:hypothetical protein
MKLKLSSINIASGSHWKLHDQHLIQNTKDSTLLCLQEAGRQIQQTQHFRVISHNQDINAESIQRRHAVTNHVVTMGNMRALHTIDEATPLISPDDDSVAHNRSITKITKEDGNALYVFNVYVTGASSNEWTEGISQIKEAFNTLIEEIQFFQTKGAVFVLMDANARTGIKSDGCTAPRVNQDVYSVDFMGEQLLRLCKKCALAILNGRQGHDRGPTRRGITSDSVIDYALVPVQALHHCSLTIHRDDMEHISDHYMLEVALETNIAFTPVHDTENKQRQKAEKLNRLEALEEKFFRDKKNIDESLSAISEPTDIYGYLHELTIAVPPTETQSEQRFEQESQDTQLQELYEERSRCRVFFQSLKYHHPWKAQARVDYMKATKEHRNKIKDVLRERKERQAQLYASLAENGDNESLQFLMSGLSMKSDQLRNLQILQTMTQRSNMTSHLRNLHEVLDFDEFTRDTGDEPGTGFNGILPSDQEIDLVFQELKTGASEGEDDMSPLVWRLIYYHLRTHIRRMIRAIWMDPTLLPT